MPDKKENTDSINLELNFIEIFRTVWSRRRFVFKITSVFIFLGLFVAIFSVKEYTSSITMVVSDSKDKMGNFAGIASLAGINLGSFNDENTIGISSYPTIIHSTPFIKELMLSKVKFSNFPQSISLYDYFSDEKNQPFNLIGKAKKYSVSLPFVLLDKMTKHPDYGGKIKDSINNGYLSYSLQEYSVSQILFSKIGLETKEEDGIVILTAIMPEPEASAQMVQIVKDLLEKYIIKFKIEKARQNLDFVSSQYLDAKNRFEKKQIELASYRDANQNINTSLSKTYEEKLESEYNLTFSVYTELAKQLEQAKIKLNETQPVLTIIDPALVPYKKSKPNRPVILFMYTLFGLTFSIGLIFIQILKVKIRSLFK
jgi:LPS O-antigen subunit length determinant protein (WzzB/FepE family)